MTMRKDKLIKLVHIAKSQLKMDDDVYRCLLKQHFNRSSSKELKVNELQDLVKVLQLKGAKIKLPFQPSKLSPMCRKVWAMWKAMANDGIIEKSTSTALNTYIRRLLLCSVRWQALTNDEANTIIESLKKWRERVGKENV
ncbi:regulatory protein GemA [Pasteurella skyensis]|uniref:Regulatory protein GemA n=1 Tax=Phocoenobacter skyensis TaxID=97481 RepID=A0AAJ6N9A4_9PAST|nr:regulatory protein GemA [Pasteurella skyensis]MDP8162837.1 regulatory protein GemA [Pasteurella skyensis]MDP8172576.1 regulatory protein GemA [Pasteurella skyensis]MDP8179076.1 regulatory protein GemA [Pasteurella skyensis]MDP8183239.1 regulatory protein GemA [Pasteurella skyensis]MDP8189290.1 regulatory protein GemA [Pasteurella skyensis]